MSRPDQPSGVATDEPRIPRAGRTVHRRSAAVPLRVVAQRLDVHEAARPSGPDPWAPARRTEPPVSSAPAPTAGAGTPAAGAVATLQQAPWPAPDVVGLPVRADLVPVSGRGRPMSRLLALVRGRRGPEAGRHRPDTIPSRGWSMFAPQRRTRRRFGVRR